MKTRGSRFETFLIGKSVLWREGIVRILRAENFRVRSSVSSPDELTGAFRGVQKLFLIVHTGADFSLALEQISVVRDKHLSGRIVVVADHYRSPEPDLALQIGAAGYLVCDMSCDAFVKSIELIMMGGAVFPPGFQASSLDLKSEQGRNAAQADEDVGVIPGSENTGTPPLSPRELAILRCLISGSSNKSIARKIDIAEATVKVHVKAILRKIRVRNRTQAAIWGMNHPLLSANDISPLPVADLDEPL
jgi:two-component system nitrate/nitrite response regulator NarL